MKLKTLIEVFLITILVLVFDFAVNNYLVFHMIAELFSISIMFALFSITWNARKILTNNYLLFIGIAALFIGILDLLHTITYKGMNVIPSPIFYANQFWIATRFFESIVLLSGLLFVAHKTVIRVRYIGLIYAAVTTGIILSVLYFKNFPTCFIENVGQTPFKIYSEYIIISILTIALGILIRKKKHFEKEIYHFLVWSILFAIISEFCFTLYVANYDYINKMGHVFKILAFFMIYRANIQNGFTKPIETFFRDLKKSEEKIKEYSEELEKQIATRNRFFSVIAHDLKNPFTILGGSTEFLLENYDRVDDQVRRKMIRAVHDTAEETYRLLENLLSWSRTQTKTLPFHPRRFDMKEVIDETLNLLRNQANLKNIVIHNQYSSEWVAADMEMIKTVLRNFLSNAIKFTHKGGTVTIQTTHEANFARISIIDTGVGIPAEKISLLFQIDKGYYTRGTENEPGTGLGLILCNEFITMNKGQIFIESGINKGSVFSFTLPLAQA